MCVLCYQDKKQASLTFYKACAGRFGVVCQVGEDNREGSMGWRTFLGTESTIVYYLQTWTSESELVQMLAQPPIVDSNSLSLAFLICELKTVNLPHRIVATGYLKCLA